MNGYLASKNGKYYAVISYRDKTGKMKSKWISSGMDIKGNKKSAQAFLADQMAELEKELADEKAGFKPKYDVLFDSYVQSWIDKEKESERLSDVTYTLYESISRNHIIPYFKKKNLCVGEIDANVLQEFFDFEKRKGNKSLNNSVHGTGVSVKTLMHIKTVLNLVFKSARRDGLIIDNPCELVILPKKQKREVSFYDSVQLEKMFSLIKDEPLFYLIYVTVFYGLRRSEVLGLKWDSVDFVRKTLTIKHTVVRGSKIIEKDSTKTECSYRTFPLSHVIEEMIRDQKFMEEENRKKFGKAYEENEYIFKQDTGKPYRPDSLSRMFGKLLDKYGLPKIRFHDLRHSCASLLISHGYQIKDVQEWLGHADIQTTANIYGHLDLTRKNMLMNDMEMSISK